MARVTQLNVNGSMLAVDADADASLLWVLRDQLDLTGSKYGCGEGQCGACTVLINGSPRRSCITAVGAVRDRQITTIEGLAKGEHLHPVQQSFLDKAAMQCAYCTSGMIMTAVSLLNANPNPSEARDLAFHGRQHLPVRNSSAHCGCGAECGDDYQGIAILGECWP